MTDTTKTTADILAADELKPCPFCGGEARLDNFVAMNALQRYSVVCDNVKCPEHGSLAAFMTEELAITAWNTRPMEDTQAAEIERLRKERDLAREGFRKYAQHDEDCPSNIGAPIGYAYECECGYRKTLAALEGSDKQN